MVQRYLRIVSKKTTKDNYFLSKSFLPSNQQSFLCLQQEGRYSDWHITDHITKYYPLLSFLFAFESN